MAEGMKKRSGARRARIVAASVLVVLILALFGLGFVLTQVMRPAGAPRPGSVSEGMTWVRSIYGWGPKQDQQLFQPVGVAVDGRGRVYVSEPQRSRIVVFDRNGGFDGIIRLMQGRNVGMVRPAGMDFDADGNLYVADRDLQRIIVFGTDRKFLRNIECGEVIGGVKVEGERVYALARGSVAIYSREGKLLNRFGEMGREPGRLDGPYALAAGSDGLLYIAESFNKRVSVFKPDGEFVKVFGRAMKSSTSAATSTAEASADASQTPFNLPTGLVFDGRGRLVALDAFLFQLEVMDTKGKLIGAYGEQGAADGRFIYPSGLAYDRAGDVFAVTDTLNNRVQIVRIAGSGSPRLDRRIPEALLQPVCYGPLLLLLLAGALLALAMRRRRDDEDEPDDGTQDPNRDEAL